MSRAVALHQAKACTQSAWIWDWHTKEGSQYPTGYPIPQPHQTFFRTERPMRSLWMPSTIPYWTRIHWRILQAVLRAPAASGENPQAKLDLALPELLGTPKGIAALTDFIRDSSTFMLTGENYTPKGLPFFHDKPEPPNIDSEDNNSKAEL
ncbi:hypothetical protein K443DRAFT_13191 [Laccaria amethystina LaAM-08-1]|uniref:Uncharacterized protein n=1 Tax=Laccaria amethystina LaAM-08-1 TaxID=1095629 RepID=A0A0C9X9S4_9AGAR|nr:hypothetical protein K443DRAFT_13191 [Laccaria amethystina LaAM-08-1]